MNPEFYEKVPFALYSPFWLYRAKDEEEKEEEEEEKGEEELK